jgi:hypothetical protein
MILSSTLSQSLGPMTSSWPCHYQSLYTLHNLKHPTHQPTTEHLNLSAHWLLYSIFKHPSTHENWKFIGSTSFSLSLHQHFLLAQLKGMDSHQNYSLCTLSGPVTLTAWYLIGRVEAGFTAESFFSTKAPHRTRPKGFILIAYSRLSKNCCQPVRVTLQRKDPWRYTTLWLVHMGYNKIQPPLS